jgi:hypothetical protein
MIALEIHLNGKRICLAGTDDLCVLHAILTVGGALGSRTARSRDHEITPYLHIGGMTARDAAPEGQHLRWATDASMAIGDRLEIQLVDIAPEAADPPAFEGLRNKYERPE